MEKNKKLLKFSLVKELIRVSFVKKYWIEFQDLSEHFYSVQSGWDNSRTSEIYDVPSKQKISSCKTKSMINLWSQGYPQQHSKKKCNVSL